MPSPHPSLEEHVVESLLYGAAVLARPLGIRADVEQLRPQRTGR